MKSNKGVFTKRAALLAVLAGSGVLAASAYAVTAEKGGDTPRCEARQLHKDDAGWEGRRAAHLAGLKEKLALTAEQESAWSTFAESFQRGPRHLGADRKAMREEFDTLSTPERLDRMQAMAEMRRARMTERAEAIKTFYAALTPAQQAVFDAEAMQKRHGHHHPRRHQS